MDRIVEMEPAEPTESSTTIVSGMSAAEILEKAETDRLAAESLRQEMQGEQMLTLRDLINRQLAATERIERTADEFEVMLEVAQQTTQEVKEQAAEIKEIIEPPPTAAPEAAAAPAAPAAPEKRRGFFSKLLI